MNLNVDYYAQKVVKSLLDFLSDDAIYFSLDTYKDKAEVLRKIAYEIITIAKLLEDRPN